MLKTIDTGLQHGTVTVDMGTVGKYEVTTFRIDGNYTDGRHPDYVEFTESIYKDLSRRDFTINAIKYTENNSVDEMLSLGISQVPVLSVNNKLLDFSTANDWVNQQ